MAKKRRTVVVGEGNLKADILIVGEAPGKDEDEIGMPFVGVSGQLLRNALSEIINLREQTFITNTVMCRPPMNKISDTYIDACASNLLSIVKIMSPDIIITVGKTSYEFFRMEKVSGPILKRYCHKFNVSLFGKTMTVLPIVHPAYIVRSMKKNESLWRENIEFLKANLLQE